ncbi:DgyrCDS13727 [Dimorphilus gyrociliatus]|uniref:DgyrCDS13727 n=1 Tax=Dimorphilus gyrociliatus TaxID=2664684 RepID=A0A7I8WBK4_9ANNE|nr:DgyrCDS13727 [Dimorphilus gyrociliatus]
MISYQNFTNFYRLAALSSKCIKRQQTALEHISTRGTLISTMVAIKLLILCSAVAVALAKIDNGKTCLRMKSDCVDNAECKGTEDSKWNCLLGICGCKNGYFSKSATECAKYRDLDQDCSNTAGDGKLCDPGRNMMCYAAICKCRNDKFERDGTGCKLKISEEKTLKQTCTEDLQCVKGLAMGSASCQGGTCKCLPPWTTVGKTCVNQEYDKSCKDADTASEKCRRGTENLECKNDKCVCKIDFNYNTRVKKCLHKDSRVNRKEGETCSPIIIADNTKKDICESKFVCRKCSSDTSADGFCVDVNKINCNG